MEGADGVDDGSNKKRRAEKQWRREEVEAGLDERDAPVIEGYGIQVASAQELSTRRFVRPRRRQGGAESAAAPEVPAVSIAAPVTVPVAVKASPPESSPQKAAEAKKTEPAPATEDKDKETKEKEEEKKTEEKDEKKYKKEETKTEAEPSKEEKTEESAPFKLDFGKSPEGSTVSQFSFGTIPSTTSDTSSSGFVFTPAASSSGRFIFGAPAKTDSDKKEETSTETGPTWVCACCTQNNPESANACSVCMVPRPAPPKSAEPGWTCACCTSSNPSESSTCSVCLVPKPL